MASSSNPNSLPVILNTHSTSRPWTAFTFKDIINLAKDHAKQLMRVKIDILKLFTKRYLLQLKADVRTVYTVELVSMNLQYGLPRMGFLSANHQQAMKNRLTEKHSWLACFEDDFGAYCLFGLHVNSRQTDEKIRRNATNDQIRTTDTSKDERSSKKKPVRKLSSLSTSSKAASILSQTSRNSLASSGSPAPSNSPASPKSPIQQGSSILSGLSVLLLSYHVCLL